MHKPLRDRPRMLSCDVADALKKIANGQLLPMAIDKSMVILALIEIAHTDEEGMVHRPPMIVERSMGEAFRNRLTKTAVFQSGYKRFERDNELNVVPVTDFFFQVVYSNGDTAECLDAMTNSEIKQSLPKRRGRVSAGDGDDDYMRDEQTNEVLIFGELAGIVVYPANSTDALLRAWLERQTKTTTGHIDKTVARIEYARPEETASLRDRMAQITPALQKALPQSPTEKQP